MFHLVRAGVDCRCYAAGGASEVPKYIVRIPYCVWQNIELEADSAGQAEELAWDHAGLSAFCGNGGTNKLVGVSGENNSVEVCDDPLDGEGLSIEVEEI